MAAGTPVRCISSMAISLNVFIYFTTVSRDWAKTRLLKTAKRMVNNSLCFFMDVKVYGRKRSAFSDEHQTIPKGHQHMFNIGTLQKMIIKCLDRQGIFSLDFLFKHLTVKEHVI